MSQENVVIVKEAYRAVNDREDEAVLRLAASDVEIEASGLMLDQGTYRGHDGFRAYTESLRRSGVTLSAPTPRSSSSTGTGSS